MESNAGQMAKVTANRPLVTFAVLVGLAALLTVPAALTPPRLYDSFWIDWVWADQFTQQLREGNVYPRWLPLSHGGLGSPVFYYYPPMAFYLSGFAGLLGLSTYASLIAAFGIAFVLSGVAMYQWLRGWTNLPLAGAAFYMAAPYHVIDFHARGALAEFAAIGLIPLVALGIARTAEGRSAYLLPLAYAALIMTHLPLALLTSIFFVAPYAVLLAGRDWQRAGSFILPLALGIALAAIYLLPALTLEEFRDSRQLWQLPMLRPENWSIWAWSVEGTPAGMRMLIAMVLIALGIPAALIAVRRKSGWAAYAVLCLVLAAGLVPALWGLPLLRSVQFPFRMLPLAEFGLATAIALLPRLDPRLLLGPLILSACFLIFPLPNENSSAPEVALAHHPDVPENLPPGERETNWPSDWALGVAAAHKTAHKRGDVTVEPVFYFPAWEVTCAAGPVPTFADPDTKLLSHRGDGCTRRLRRTKAEMAGALISVSALLVLIMMMVLRHLRRPAAHP